MKSSATTTAPDRAALLAVVLTMLCASTHGSALAEEETGEASPTAAVIWLGGMSPARIDYETRVVELALEKSRGEYGDYTFTTNATPRTNQRVERDMRVGKEVNLVSQPVWVAELDEDSSMTVIPLPVAHGLLGYRRCIVRAEDLPRFREVRTLADLQQLTAGLGKDWVEQQVFEQNQLKWNGGRTTDQLLLMLARGRFDYFPLGAAEVDKALATSPYREQLAVVPDLVLYYPLPVYIQVSVNQPYLAERLEYGLREAQADGTLEALFSAHYGPVLELLRAERPAIINLTNPYLPAFAEDAGPVLLENL